MYLLSYSEAIMHVSKMELFFRNYSAITSIISGILALIAEQKMSAEADYVCHWSLVSPQHPLVMVLQQHPAAIDNILSEVESICLYNTK